MPFVTALRARGRGRVLVELDGTPWRVLPTEAVLRAGIDVGGRLDRERARALRRELVRLDALRIATGALRRRDLSARALGERLNRAGKAPSARDHTLATLVRAGLVDDARASHARAAALAARGYGNAAIFADLAARGFDRDVADAAVASLTAEVERACAIVERRGAGEQTARFLGARGFDEDAVAAARVAAFANDP